MVKKDRSFLVNKTYLLQMMPTFYQTHLENQLAPSEYLLLCILIDVLQNIKEVNLEKLANALPLPIEFESRRKKLQIFLSLSAFDIEKMWLPIINNWLTQNFPNGEIVYLVIDRTSWARINLMMVSIVYDQRAIPIYFELLPKLGSSNFTEQIQVFTKILPVFNNYQPVILGDREFCSIGLANWLRARNVKFCLRLKKSEFVEVENGIWTELDDLGLKPGISLFLQGVRVTKSQKIGGFNLACKWKRKLHGWVPEEGWFILTNLSNLKDAIVAYKKRFNIEEMFRDFKSGGYNLEGTLVSNNRLISLILIIAIAYSTATFKGQRIKRIGVQKYVGRIKENGRIHRRHSSFYIGLYGQSWVHFMESSWENVTKLMKLNRNKLLHYLRGKRAMELILSAS